MNIFNTLLVLLPIDFYLFSVLPLRIEKLNP